MDDRRSPFDVMPYPPNPPGMIMIVRREQPLWWQRLVRRLMGR